MSRCEGYVYQTAGGIVIRGQAKASAGATPCQSVATTCRRGWKFGKGKKAIVRTRVRLCQDCADVWDENLADASAEAAS